MIGYRIALFLHLLALVAASSAAGVAHLAHTRYRHAGARAEARGWHSLLGKVSRVFPIAVLTLVATGSYMVSAAGTNGWALGWVQAGLVAAVLLFVSGATIGARERRVTSELERSGSSERGAPLPWDSLGAVLSWVNTCLAVSVVFVMANKAGLAGSLATLAVGIAVGAAIGISRERAAVSVDGPLET
jgi:hypothetical protein